jgi:hypothetical protein
MRGGKCRNEFPIVRDFLPFLKCGVAEFGFLRLHYDSYGMNRILPFSCKKRAFCPSCRERRMADTAAHLMDRVIKSRSSMQTLGM